MHLLLAVFAVAVVVRAARLQIFQGKAWKAKAERQQFSELEMPAPRGAILDAGGVVLAQSRDAVQLSVAPREVRDARRLRRSLARAGLSTEWLGRAVDVKRVWVTLPGTYLASDVAGVIAQRGVHARPLSVRSYSVSSGTGRLVGHVNPENRPVDGLELALDSILSGTAGSTALAHDVRGRSFESPAAPGVAARPGNTVVLTLNHQLQEIAERALDDATTRMSSDGGDIVILDPHSGEVLAMASRRANQSSAATAVTEPFEPGSTLKPFVVAGLLARGRAKESDIVDTRDGTLTLENRVIHDEHKVGLASVAEVLQWSSNVGIVTLAQRLAPREQFEVLRDFGFGTATGIPYPSESNGVLRAPQQWTSQSPASLAMGYEISVTPLQLAAAYAVLANGGELLEPTLVKEVRAPDGSVRYRHTRRVVRRVISEDVAQRMRRMLLNVVENGTALQADLSSYLLAGKTGTPRRTVNGRYAAQQYNPNFVGLFPADEPQYVIVVKLTNPRDERGSFYGGSTAAPLTRAVLQAAIAARDAALDRNKLASSAASSGGAARTATVTPIAAGGEIEAADDKRAPLPPFVVDLPHPVPTRMPVPKVVRQVPDVRGLVLRDAVRSLHSAGFQVRLIRSAAVSDGETSPSAGTLAAPGTLVRLSYDF